MIISELTVLYLGTRYKKDAQTSCTYCHLQILPRPKGIEVRSKVLRTVQFVRIVLVYDRQIMMYVCSSLGKPIFMLGHVTWYPQSYRRSLPLVQSSLMRIKYLPTVFNSA